MLNSDNNVIGGASPASRNLFSGGATRHLGRESPTATVIQGNLIGTDVTGTLPLPNGTGISLAQADNTTIGGSAAGARNVIAGNLGSGIGISYGSGYVIRGNYIGTDITGTKASRQRHGHQRLRGARTSPSAAAGPGDGNLVSGNNGIGIYVYNFASDTTILGNRIGTDVTGTLPLGNITGIATSNDSGGLRIGGTGPGEANVIAFNKGYLAYSLPVGALIYNSSKQIPIRGNSFHDNEQLGIAFNGELPTFNDPGDVDTGSNDQQNFPIVRSVEYGNSTTRVLGKFNSVASTTYMLDFYANPPCLRFPREFLEGETYLGATEVTTDAERPRRARRHAARRGGERGAHLRHGDGPRREHLRVLAADHLRDDAVVGPRGRRPASADLRHGLRRARRADHRRRRGGLHVRRATTCSTRIRRCSRPAPSTTSS